MAQVRDIMDASAPTVTPQDTFETLIARLRESDLPGIVVVNDGGRAVGIITENDLIIGDEEESLHVPHMISLFGGVVFLDSFKRFEERLRKATAATAADLMTDDPLTVEAGADVREAAHLIAEHGHNRLPVVEHGRYVGVVTRVDVLQALAAQ